MTSKQATIDPISSPPPANAFATEFLSRLSEQDEPPQALAAELSGPWAVRRLSAGFGVFRSWESPLAGDLPRATFADRSLALLAAAVMPGLGYGGLFYLEPEHGPEGFAVYERDALCGHLQYFDEALVTAMNLAVELVRSPEALALLLRAAGPTVLNLTGRRLQRGLEDEARLAGAGAEETD
jgi:hypothetical protein